MKRLSAIKTILVFTITAITTLSTQAQSNSKKATTIANNVVKAMGGIENYNNTHFIKWDFGKRILFWDKWTGDVRVENPKENQVIIVNINTLKGKAFENGQLIEDPKKTKKLLNKAKKWWINDSYWLVMPWKLQDPGVTLKYIKTDKLANGITADILQLTFQDVGVTPNNKYWIYVDQKDQLIKQWDFFKNFNDEKPSFSKPWDNYQKAGHILLSYNRSDFGPKNVVVKQEFNAKLFTEL
ncbi:hypothetical protein GCM10022291_10250 [Postechiella marina]|uniref:Uncharacterized protein n=1 Tax=Postechiella marina TaxID=943941 RepID=A0ABP8C545_9FLAO